MRDDMPKGLNAFSRKLLKALLKKHPDWSPYAQVGGIYPAQDPVKEGTLLLRVPRPCGPPDEYLQVATAAWEGGPEVTVEFGGTHNHWDIRFDPTEEDGEPGREWNKKSLVAYIVDLVEGIVHEQTVVLCTVEDGRITSGGFVPPPGRLHRAWGWRIGENCRFRSWMGTYDAERVLVEEDLGRPEA